MFVTFSTEELSHFSFPISRVRSVFVIVFQHAFVKCTYLPLYPPPSLILDTVAHGLFSALSFEFRKYQIEHGCL